jgi:uncharacterized protein YdbL (DUF1318 family)
MQKKGNLIISAIILCTLMAAGQVWAQGIKERMRDRLPVIVDLKARGVVGENNLGYLAYLKGQSEKQDVVAAENKDRELVYQAIAKKEGTTPDLVGKRRARQLAEKASPGEWLQNAQGQWYRK